MPGRDIDAEIERLTKVIEVRNEDVNAWMDKVRELYAERERMLDLMGRLVKEARMSIYDRPKPDAWEEIVALLTEHDRLPKEDL